ncbi:CDF family cation diffusion facilitator [Ligilactobacillus araffinosus DSM 20653]|uniref:CDF family cation diffusion facilitator n=2 Tax=Ligilactobacillus araffinosus TaxID=147809 RepID=A0A0R1ZJE6_9LACO|nr:CDF family cation diffusion facilitator [Ligilactobacillus araffinosus DSM 20653]
MKLGLLSVRRDLMEAPNVSTVRFFWVTVLNVLITVVEILGGLFSGSLALLSDAFHNLSDSASIVISYIAQRIANKPETPQRTFGYRRAEILSALLNAGLLIVIALFIVIEAAKRFMHPDHVNGDIMTVVAVIGLLANFVSAALLHNGSRHSLNIKATYLHILADGLSSIGVVITGIVLIFWHITWLDPIVSVLVAFYIAYEALPIIQKTINILMQAAPDIDYDAIKEDITSISQVNSVHHVHAWLIDEHHTMFSAHINCEDIKLSEVEPIYRQISKLLKDKYHISHVTIQAECQRGINEKMFDIDRD